MFGLGLPAPWKTNCKAAFTFESLDYQKHGVRGRSFKGSDQGHRIAALHLFQFYVCQVSQQGRLIVEPRSPVESQLHRWTVSRGRSRLPTKENWLHRFVRLGFRFARYYCNEDWLQSCGHLVRKTDCRAAFTIRFWLTIRKDCAFGLDVAWHVLIKIVVGEDLVSKHGSRTKTRVFLKPWFCIVSHNTNFKFTVSTEPLTNDFRICCKIQYERNLIPKNIFKSIGLGPS